MATHFARRLRTLAAAILLVVASASACSTEPLSEVEVGSGFAFGGFVTRETGDAVTIQVRMSSAPDGDVQLTLESSDPSEGAVSPDSLTFSMADWSIPQSIVISGVDDSVDDGDRDYHVTLSSVEGNEIIYLTNVDDDAAGLEIVIASDPARTDEDGTGESVTLRLTSQPTAAVAVELASSDPSEGVVTPTSVQFTADDWDTARDLTVTGVDDDERDGDIAYEISVVVVSDDPLYDESTSTIRLWNYDDEPNIQRVSVASGGAQSAGVVDVTAPAISSDGRFVVFASAATDMVDQGGDGQLHTYLRDRSERSTSRVTANAGSASNQAAVAGISGDGGTVVFASSAGDLVDGDLLGMADIFAFGRVSEAMTRLSVGVAGAEANFHSVEPDVSGDGTLVAFLSGATNLVSDGSGAAGMFATLGPSRSIVGLPDAGLIADEGPAVSADGSTIAYALRPAAGTGASVYVYDVSTGDLVSVSQGLGGDADGGSNRPRLSADGRFVTYASSATNLVLDDTNGVTDVFVHDQSLGTTERVSVSTDGTPANGLSSLPDISADGRYVVFGSSADNLVAGDTNGAFDIFLVDRDSGDLVLISASASGEAADGKSLQSRISGDGRYVAFVSDAENLVAGDTNGAADVFLARW